MFHGLERAAIYAGAKPTDRPLRTMQIVKRSRGTVTPVTPIAASPAIVARAASTDGFLSLAGPTKNASRSTGLTWED
ncbi:MAG: hypothetical protein ACO3VH_07150 [Ilumatobacteraceae bacterium]